MKTSRWITVGLVATLLGGLPGSVAADEARDATEIEVNQEPSAGEASTELQAEEALRVSGAGTALDDAARSAIAPPGVYIENIITGGMGCSDPSTVSTQVSSDHASLLVNFDGMQLVTYPPGSLIRNTGCVVGVTFHIPPGWQFRVASVKAHGYAFLSPGQRGRQTLRFFFAGDPSGMARSTLWGPFNDEYELTESVGSNSWSQCGGSQIFAIDASLNLNVVNNPYGNAILKALDTQLQWLWQPCH